MKSKKENRNFSYEGIIVGRDSFVGKDGKVTKAFTSNFPVALVVPFRNVFQTIVEQSKLE